MLLNAFEVFTWLGLYGHRLLKGTQLFTALPDASALRRKLTKARRLAHAKQHAGEKNKFQDYTKSETGAVTGGRDLQSTAIYPMSFCRGVFSDPKLQRGLSFPFFS